MQLERQLDKQHMALTKWILILALAVFTMENGIISAVYNAEIIFWHHLPITQNNQKNKKRKFGMKHIGLVMECDYRIGSTQEEAFAEAFTLADTAEKYGIDGVWLAERHFAAHKGPTDPMGGSIPSVASVPLVMATAIAARTQNIKIATGVSVLPLCHPIRLAEEAATLDHISKGRLIFGIGRSSFPKSYQGYGVPYSESRDIFQESLEIILKAWNDEKLNHKGKYYEFEDVSVMPQPYQTPHPPIVIAANTPDTFPVVGTQGFPLATGLRGSDIKNTGKSLQLYKDAWKAAGHPGEPEIYMRIPVYVHENPELARENPRQGAINAFDRQAQNAVNAVKAAGPNDAENLARRAQALSSLTYDDLLEGRLAYGTPEQVIEKLRYAEEEMGITGIIMEPNVGGLLTKEQINESVALVALKVSPKLKTRV